MIIYEVTVDIDASRAEALHRYLAERHLPDMLGTGCFTGIGLEQESATRFRSRYECAAQADLDRYLAEHAAAMRADFVAHFPDGAAVARAVWRQVARWAR